MLCCAVTVSGGKVAQFLFYTFEGTVFGEISDVQTEIKSVSIFIKKSEKLPQKKVCEVLVPREKFRKQIQMFP